MNGANSFERPHLRIECGDELAAIVSGRGQMNDITQTIVGYDDDCGVDVASCSIEDRIEPGEIDRFTADLDEVAGASEHTQRIAFDFTSIFRNKPAVDFRIDEDGAIALIEKRIAGQHGWTAKSETFGRIDAHVDVRKDFKLRRLSPRRRDL